MNDQLEALINQMIERGVHFEDALRVFENRFIQKSLKRYDGNVSKTAKALGIHRNTLSRKLEGVDRQRQRRKRSR